MENENKNAVTQTDQKTEETVTQTVNKTEEKAEKTFTQEEVNAMVKKENAKVLKKYEGVDLDEYKKWVESQKTAEEKQAEKEAEYKKTLNELNTLKQTNAVLSAGVNKDDADYVLFKVSKMDGDFDENLAKFLKDNPKYLKQEVEQTEPKATGVPVRTISSKNDGVLGILASKHPEIDFEK